MMSYKDLVVDSGKGLFSLANCNKIKNKFLKENKTNPNGAVNLLSLPSDCGGGIHRGANWGPLKIKLELLDRDLSYCDLGDIRVIPHLLHDKYLNEKTLKSIRENLELNAEAPVSPLSIAESFAKNYYATETKPLLMLGGDHSCSFPFAINAIDKFEDIAIIHFDAHPDLSKSRMGLDINFSSWAYHCAEKLNNKNKFFQLGIRSTCQTKEYWEAQSPVTQIWSKEIKEKGISDISSNLILKLKEEKVQNLYISIDVDALDTKFMSSTGTPEKNGLAPHEITSIISNLKENFKIVSADIVEYAPFINYEGEAVSQTNSALTASMLTGKIIELMGEQ